MEQIGPTSCSSLSFLTTAVVLDRDKCGLHFIKHTGSIYIFCFHFGSFVLLEDLSHTCRKNNNKIKSSVSNAYSQNKQGRANYSAIS